jgi:hypothetical protein
MPRLAENVGKMLFSACDGYQQDGRVRNKNYPHVYYRVIFSLLSSLTTTQVKEILHKIFSQGNSYHRIAYLLYVFIKLSAIGDHFTGDWRTRGPPS